MLQLVHTNKYIEKSQTIDSISHYRICLDINSEYPIQNLKLFELE